MSASWRSVQLVSFSNGRVVRVVVTAQNATDGDKQVNAYYYDLDDSGAPLEPANNPQTLADTYRDVVVPKYRLCYSSAWNILPVVVMEAIDPQHPTAPRSEWTSGTVVAGQYAISGDLLPRALCSVATLLTDHVGRRARGRLFLGGTPTESDQANGVWGTLQLGRWQAILDAIPLAPDLSSGVGTGVEAHWSVFSRTSRIENLDRYLNPVISKNLRTQCHWLRSRSTVS